MKILKSDKKGFTVSLEVEVSLETLNHSVDMAFKEIVKHAKVPGFRKGKAPRHIFEQHHGNALLIQEGLTEAVNTTYTQAIKELDLRVVDYPRNLNIDSYEEGKPVKFTCEVDVRPDVKLGKYKGIKVKQLPTEVSDEDVEKQITRLLDQHAEFSPTTRPVAENDIITANLSATIDGEEYSDWTRNGTVFSIGNNPYSETFDKEITGSKKGDTKTFSVSYPKTEKNEAIREKTVEFTVELVETQEKICPELSDAFVEKVSPHKTVEEFKTNLLDMANKKMKEDSDMQLKEDLIKQIIENASMDIPNGMVETEIDQDIKQYENSLRQSRSTLEKFLEATQQDMTQFRNNLRENATKRVQSDLVIEAIMKKESIEANDDDIKAEIQRLVPSADTDEKVESHLKQINIDGFKSLVSHRKTVDFLVSSAKIES